MVYLQKGKPQQPKGILNMEWLTMTQFLEFALETKAYRDHVESLLIDNGRDFYEVHKEYDEDGAVYGHYKFEDDKWIDHNLQKLIPQQIHEDDKLLTLWESYIYRIISNIDPINTIFNEE